MKYMFIVENLKTKFKHNSQLSPSLNFGLLPLIFFFPLQTPYTLNVVEILFYIDIII